MKINGFIKGDLDGSFIYFIFSKELLYIGETQKITFARWVSHFYNSGTFSQKTRKFGIPNIDYIESANLLSIELEEIRELFPEVRWRTITQAIEHQVHSLLYISQRDMIKNYYEKYQPEINKFTIISDTSRTAPRKLLQNENEFVKGYTNELLKNVYEYL